MKLSLSNIQSSVEVIARRPHLVLSVDGLPCTVHETISADGKVELEIDGQHYALWRCVEGERVQLKLDGRTYSLEAEDPVLTAASAGGAGNELTADMPGVVVAVKCSVGDVMNAGDALLVLESMKMQITVSAPRAGKVETVHVALNESFQKGARLVTLAAEDVAP